MIELVAATPAVAAAVIRGDGALPPRVADWPHADTADALRPLADHPEHCGPGTFLILRGGLVVGDCGWFGPPSAEDPEVEIGYGVAPSVRRQGVATEAVRQLLAWVATQGATRVRADVQPGNTPSLALLARLGFSLTEERAGHQVLTLSDLAHIAQMKHRK